ncbi:MAG: hypothetical protein QHC67_03540 [Sphingobium sp.]|uniref:hypothetical protein n=1 Tax=Sphingobium sp. TaxID=1912891 RepID=UPI0029B9FA3B|nr:hypothetical protein [Sphingobium sp.]MDX3908872.1 hypothetical protein [Sphingobium sp.]
MNFTDFVVIMMLLSVRRSREDWQPGDLAICISEDWPSDPGNNPKINDLLRVTDICWEGRFLHFSEKPSSQHWPAINFRKVKPDTSAADDAAWVQLLERFRGKVDA